MLIKILARVKKCFTLVIVQLSQNIKTIQIGCWYNMKHETASIVIKNVLD